MLSINLQHQLQKQEKENLVRTRNIITNTSNLNNKIVINTKSCINFSSNDYLGLIKHAKINEAFILAVKKYGFGSGASVFISGYSDAHYEVENQFASWLNTDKTILFSSGYLANIGVISTLAQRKNIIFSDKLCHASLLDGIQLSRAKHYRYKHCNIKHLAEIAKYHKPDLIISETVFSMEGDIAPIENLAKSAQNYNSYLVIDDAHGIGLFGKDGAGICKKLNITQNEFSCLIAPLGKAFNAIGAIVAGKKEIIDAVIQLSRAYRYTTAPPPAICAAISAALSVIKIEKWRREQLEKNIKFFIAYTKEKNLNLISEEITPIKSVLVYDNNKIMQLQNFLLTKGFYVAAIRPPTVAANTARLRISLNSLHSQSEIMQLVDAIATGIKNVDK